MVRMTRKEYREHIKGIMNRLEVIMFNLNTYGAELIWGQIKTECETAGAVLAFDNYAQKIDYAQEFDLFITKLIGIKKIGSDQLPIIEEENMLTGSIKQVRGQEDTQQDEAIKKMQQFLARYMEK